MIPKCFQAGAAGCSPGLILLLLLTVGISQPANAILMQAKGHAEIVNGRIAEARTAAREAAMEELSLNYSAHVRSRETVENGRLVQSRFTVDTRSRARDIRVAAEHISPDGRILTITLSANMTPALECAGQASSSLRRTLAITGFPILRPEQATIGNLFDADRKLPEILARELGRQGHVQPRMVTDLSLFPAAVDLPSHQSFDNRVSDVLPVARELGTQFVLTGAIRDMGVVDPTAWDESIVDRIQRGLGMSDRRRRFEVDLMLVDGYSGSIVYRERFESYGEWNASEGEVAGFGTPGFLHTGYGHAANEAIARMVHSVDESLACQPFMARIERVDGNSVRLKAGATSGLRPGMTLNVYRTYTDFTTLDQPPELHDAGVELTVGSVFPEFSTGVIPVQADMLNVQRDDVVIVF